MDTLNLILNLIIICGIGLLLKFYLPSYFKKKGENLADKEDIAQITKEIENAKLESTTQIERLKTELSKTILVHKLQFETEFQAYRDIWDKLLIVRNRTLELRPMIDKYKASEEERAEIKQQRITNFADGFNSFAELAERNKPFYPKVIWTELENLLNIIRKEAIGYTLGNPDSDGKKYWDEALANRDQILSKIDSICEAIRDRIETLKLV